MRYHIPHLYYMTLYRLGGELFGGRSVFELEVSYLRAAEGGEVGACTYGFGQAGDQGAHVGTAAACDGKGCCLLDRIEVSEDQGVDRYEAALALDVFAAAVCLVEAFSFDLDSGGHRWGLAESAREACRG